MLRSLLFAIAFVAGLQLVSARSEPARLALLIGNERYADAVGALKNPHNDVALIAAALRKIGFDVRVLKDATYRSLEIELRRHAMKLRDAGPGAIGFFYYSGHGVANPDTGANYLIPVDVRTIADKDVWLYAFEQKSVIDKLSSIAGNATHFVVFDACRDELITPGAMSKSAAKAKGFTPVASKAGLLIAYSTAPGKTASDEGAGGGPYASVLAEELVKPGIEAVAMFRNVQLRVRRKIKQDPWLSFPALPEIYLAGTALPAATRDTTTSESRRSDQAGDTRRPALAPMSPAANAWLIVQQSDNAAILEAFAKEFADSVFAKFARARIEDLTRRKSIGGVATNELATKLQTELKRLNCYTGEVDGKWGGQSQLAMVRLNQNARTSFETDLPSQQALDVLSALKTSICPDEGSAAPAPNGPAPSGRKRSWLHGVCRDGNVDHCRRGCSRGIATACSRLRNMPAAKRYRGGTCRDGNMDVCRHACSRGRKKACAQLRRRAGSR